MLWALSQVPMGRPGFREAYWTGSALQEKHEQELGSQQEKAGWFGSPGYNLLLKTMY